MQRAPYSNNSYFSSANGKKQTNMSKASTLHFDELKQAKLGDLEISGAPTLLLIDKSGFVNSIWLGKLPDDTERKLLAKLSAN
jgi:hypothetical protein